MRSFLGSAGLGVVFAACGGTGVTIVDGGTEGGGGDSGRTCMPEICGDNKDNDCDNVVDNGCKGLGTYVSSVVGDDTNPGTQVKPVKTIAKGMANAQTIGPPLTVYVAAAHYSEKVTLVEGVSLEGGYRCDTALCDWSRDPNTNDTAILDQDFEGVLAPANVTRKTRIDGFRIQGQNGTPQAGLGGIAITIVGSPTVSGNRINAGDITGGGWPRDRSIGVLIQGPTMDPDGALVERNKIRGGTSVNGSIGLLFDKPQGAPMGPAVAMVRSNDIRSGAGAYSEGVGAWACGGKAALLGNDIATGTVMSSTGGGAAWGVAVGGTLLVEGNLINADPNAVGSCTLPTTWCGGVLSESSSATIVNNVIYGIKAPRSAGVFLGEFEIPAGLCIVNGNVIDGGGIGLTANPTVSSAVVLQIGTCAMCGFKGVFGRFRNNILQGGQNLNRYGVYEEQVPGKTNKPEALEANDFWFPPLPNRNDSFHHVWNGSSAMDLMMPPANNLSVDPQLDSTFHIAKTSGCVDKGVATEAPPKDRDGDPRPAGPAVDIGADEAK